MMNTTNNAADLLNLTEGTTLEVSTRTGRRTLTLGSFLSYDSFRALGAERFGQYVATGARGAVYGIELFRSGNIRLVSGLTRHGAMKVEDRCTAAVELAN